jgi:hypothetical protein
VHGSADREQALALLPVVRDGDRAPRRSQDRGDPLGLGAGGAPVVWIVSCAAPVVGGSSCSSAWTAARDAASISSMIAG